MMDRKTVDARIAGERQRCLENIAARTERPNNVWWLSFADGNRPHGQQFLGAVMLHANDFMEAITEAGLLGINPGGECRGMEVKKQEAIELIDDKWKRRLLSAEDCTAFDAEMAEKLKLDHSIYVDKKQEPIQ